MNTPFKNRDPQVRNGRLHIPRGSSRREILQWALAGAGLAAFVLQQVFGFIRPEPAYWTAHPQALNMTIFAATLLIVGIHEREHLGPLPIALAVLWGLFVLASAPRIFSQKG